MPGGPEVFTHCADALKLSSNKAVKICFRLSIKTLFKNDQCGADKCFMPLMQKIQSRVHTKVRTELLIHKNFLITDENNRFFYEPGYRTSMKLPLRRTLVLKVRYSANDSGQTAHKAVRPLWNLHVPVNHYCCMLDCTLYVNSAK